MQNHKTLTLRIVQKQVWPYSNFWTKSY